MKDGCKRVQVFYRRLAVFDIPWDDQNNAKACNLVATVADSVEVVGQRPSVLGTSRQRCACNYRIFNAQFRAAFCIGQGQFRGRV